MKKIILLLAFFCGIQAASAQIKAPEEKKDYNLNFRVKGLQDTIIYMANYYGGKQYYKDTADVDANGYFSFKGSKSYPSGIYMMVLPDRKSYFEFIINETEFSMETEKGKLVESMKIKGSVENQVFYDYMNFIAAKQESAKPIKQELGKTDDEEKVAQLKEQLSNLDKEVKDFQKSFIEKNKTTFAAKVFKASPDPEIPEDLEAPEGKEGDRIKFKYFRDHYLDNIDFTDERYVRTPIYHNKLEYYITKLTPQIPDSINKAADVIIGKAKASDELFKYTVHYITNHYEKSKIMGMDAVFVHMAENYYMKGNAFWVDSNNLSKISERAMTLKPLLLNKVAPNVILPDAYGKWYNLHEVDANYTVLYFWDSGCGHCKKATPKLKEFYSENKVKLKLEVFAVGTELETKEWQEYVEKNELPWINVSDTPEINKNAYDYLQKGLTTLNSLNFRDIYDIYSTPVVFILDKDKKIIGKRIGVEQIGDFIKDFEKMRKENEG